MDIKNLRLKNNTFSKSTQILLVLVFFLGIIYSCSSGPKIEFANNELQIGEVKAGTSKKVTTKLKNTGRDTLIIQNVSAGCHCTKVDIDKNKVPPGEESDLALTYFANENMSSNEEIKIAVIVRSNTIKKFDEFYINGIIKNDH